MCRFHLLSTTMESLSEWYRKNTFFLEFVCCSLDHKLSDQYFMLNFFDIQMSFHRKVGRNIRLEASNTVGKRLDEEFAQVIF